jgi:ABC-type nitrate/sulfonate/bicarbonate transport system permease component
MPAGTAFWKSALAGRIETTTIRLAVLAVVLIAWQAVGNDSAMINMPTFTRTLSAFADLVRSGELPVALVNSNIALFWGYLGALVFGVPLGIAMGLLQPVRAAVNPYLTVLLTAPLIATLPVLQAVFGLGLETRIVVVFLASFVYIAINTEVGVRTTPADLDEMARSFCASRWQRLRMVVLPHAFPAIMAGARLGVGRGVVAMVIAELFLVGSGLGSLLSLYNERFDTGSVMAIALTMVLEGIVLMAIGRRIERYAAQRA